MGIQGDGDLYLFHENSLLAPPETPDSDIGKGVKAEKVWEALKELNIPKPEHPASCPWGDYFSIPPLEGPEPINALVLDGKETLPGWKEIPLRQALNVIAGGAMADGEGDMGRLLRAFHIGQWRKESRFCGTCGTGNEDAPSELARQCPGCGRLEFPRIAPAIITVIINDKDEALLAHNRKFAPGVYSLIAGFNEAGESLEATVAREVREEVGLEVRNITYIRSQPWPFPNSLMLGFAARHAGGSIRPDGVEIEDAQWFSREKLPDLPGNGSVSRYLIGLWLEGKLENL